MYVCVMACHTVHTFVQVFALHANVHYSESLDCFIVFGFCYPYWILTGSSLGFPVVILCHVDPAALGLKRHPFHVSSRWVDAKWINLVS